MSTPVAGSLSVTPLYASAADVLVLWDDVNATWRSLPSVSNPMSVAQGGTGQTTLTANAVLVGNGTGPITASAITSDNGATLRVSTNQVIGNAVTSPPSHALVINNAASTPQATSIVPQAWLASESGNAPILLDYYATASGQGNLIGRRSRGTAAAPAAVQTGDNLLSILGAGRGASGYSGFQARLDIQAGENWTDTAQGSQILLSTATLTTTTVAQRMSLRQGVVIGNPAPDPGQGGLVLNANAAALPAPPAGTLLQIGAADGSASGLTLDAFGSTPTLSMRAAINTAASPQPLNSGAFLFSIFGSGYGATAYANNKVGITAATTEAWSDTANGTCLRFRTTLNGTTTLNEAMRIDHNGNVGIGTTAPGSKLTVVGGSVQNRGNAAAGAYNLIVDSGPTGADSSTSMVLFRDFTAAASVGAINRTGTNSVLYATTSDARLKADIVESKRGLDALMAIKVSDYKMGKTASQGLLAQDVAKVYPEAVHEGGKDPNLEPWMIDYGRMTPLIIKAVQDLAAEVKALAPPPARKARAG